MPYEWSPSAVTTCRYDTGSWITETRTDTSGVTPCAYPARYSKLHTTHVFSYTAVNSSAWSGLDASEDECVRHDWLNGASQEERSRERDDLCSLMSVWVLNPFVFFLTVPLLQLSPPAVTSPLPPSLLFFFILSCLCFHPGSCVAPAHAGSQHQSTLVRDFRVFYHALPQPLFLPVWIHPVYLVPVAFALRGKEGT